MTNESLLLSYGMVAVAVLISYYNHLRMEKGLVTSSIRGTLQLILMGFLLEYILKIEEPVYHFVILFIMCLVAGTLSGNRGKAVPHSHAIAIAGIVAGSLVTFAVLYYVGVIQPEARYVIPLGGMIIGNSMKAASLGLDRLISELGHQRKRIDNLLALGASRSQAVIGAVRQAVKAAMMPTIDTMKTVGLVHLPGIMTGYIIAGGSPLTAVKFQLSIIYMITGATGITCLTVILLAARQCFSPDTQLLPHFQPTTGH